MIFALRAWAALALAAALTACGASQSGAPGPALAAADVDAPAWARRGDERDGKAAHLFVCQGAGKTEGDALETAGALCNDKICKLCGVVVESVVQTEETLTGVDLKRQVIERCRMVRTTAPEVTRKSVACGPEGCTAFVQVRYADAERDEACKRMADGDFASPEACEGTITAFSKVPGYSEASFRQRVALIDQALSSCANIDVRPTPLMGSLDAKLKAGMSSFNAADADTPGFLKSHWLKPHAPLWKQYEESPKFVERLKLLRGYLAHKVSLMRVIEASVPDDLDTVAAVKTIAEACGAVRPDEAYGVRHVQIFAASQLFDRFFAGRLTVDVEPVAKVIRGQYPPETLEEVMPVAQLFAIGGKLEADEWAYLMRTPLMSPGMRRGLEVPDHGKPEMRKKRFFEALTRSLADAKPKQRFSRFQHVLPNDGMFLLGLETDLPADVREGLDREFLKDIFHRSESRMTHAQAGVYLARFAESLSGPAGGSDEESKAHRQRCIVLSDDLKFLHEQGQSVSTLGGVICSCLTDGLADEGLSLVNKSSLYDRALAMELPCVAP